MPYHDGLNLDDLEEETSIYAKPEDGNISLLGRFSDKQAVYDAVDEAYADHVGRILIFSSLDARTRPRPFEHSDPEHKQNVEEIVSRLENSPHLAGARLASPGGVNHVSRFEYTVSISAHDYDFACYFTPDESDVDTTEYNRPDGLANTFDAICDSALEGLDYTVEFVAGETYVPQRGAQHHNIRLYGQLVPMSPPVELAARRAFRRQSDVADALPSYRRRSPDVSWVQPDGSLSLAETSYDVLVVVDTPREPMDASEFDSGDFGTLSTTQFDRAELIEMGEPLVATVARETDIDLSLSEVGVQMHFAEPDTQEYPVLGVEVHSDPDD